MAAPQGVQFDGTNDYLARDADLTGNADSKLVTGAFWFRANDATISAIDYIWYNVNTALQTGFEIQRDDAEKIRIVGKDSGNNIRLDVLTSAYADTSWHHICFSFDMSDTGKRHIYVDDVSDLATVTTYTNATLDFTKDDHSVGEAFVPGFGALGAKFPGDLADFWLDFGTYVDLSVTANRRKFIAASAANAVDLGSDGSTPTGTAPLVFFSGATATWHTNDGTGGGFTENGALTDASANPPDYEAVGATVAVPSASTVTFSGQTPTVNPGRATVQDAVSIALGVNAPTLSLTPPTASLLLSVNEPTLATSIRPGQAGLSLDTPTPIVDVDRNVDVPDAGQIQINPQTPELATDAVPGIDSSSLIQFQIQPVEAFGRFTLGRRGSVSYGFGVTPDKGVVDDRKGVGFKGVVEEKEEFE